MDVLGGVSSLQDGSLTRTAIDTSGTYMAHGYIQTADNESLQLYHSAQPFTHAGEKKGRFEPFIYINANNLPRQARDKHREISITRPFSLSGGANANHTWKNHSAIGLLTLRVDGFVALEAPYDFQKPPQFTTVAIDIPTDCRGAAATNSSGSSAEAQLLVNMVTGVAGHIAIAVEAADGRPPPPTAHTDLAHANRLVGNAVSAVASWNSVGGVEEGSEKEDTIM